MKLHRTTGRPDWADIDPARYNLFQKVAAMTHGVVSPANVITIIGLVAVLIGLAAILRGEYGIGIILLIAGRLLDILDGVVADKTGTKAPLGELLDAGVDKIGTFLTILVLYVAHIADWWIITGLLLPQLWTLGVVIYLRQKGNTVHPTRTGKLGMALLWVGIIGLFLIKVWHSPSLVATTTLIVALSIILGLIATWQYATERN